MIGAMLVLLAVIAGFLVIRELGRTTPETPVRAVDYVESAEYARSQASFDVVAPESLPDGWRATSARYTPAPAERWHLGVLTDEERYVGLEQGPRPEGPMVEEYVDEAAARGEQVRVDGAGGVEQWTSYTDDGDLALVRHEGGVTTLVVGTVDQELLVDYAESLR